MKYSIIVCAYNAEQYVDVCLNSLMEQSYSNFEIILINDGSTDSTKEKMKNWKEQYPDKIHFITSKNQGLSASRNKGIKAATGDYLLFVDIDDKLDPKTLEIINQNATEKPDLIKFGLCMWHQDGTCQPIKTHYPNQILKGEEAFKILVQDKQIFEMAQLYAYRKEYWISNHFEFTVGRYHEDFGLIPFVLLKSNKVKMLNHCFYYYLQTDNSITRNHDYQKNVKRAYDVLNFSKELKSKIQKEDSISNSTKKIFNSFLSNAVILQYQSLKDREQLSYQKEILENHIIDDLLEDNIFRKLKKWKIKYKLNQKNKD